MSSSDYLPTTLGNLDSWEENFLAKLPTYAASFGLSPAEVTAITNAITAHRTAYTAQLASQANVSSLVENTKAKRKAAISGLNGIRAIANMMKNNSAYTKTAGLDLGIESTYIPPSPDLLVASIKAKVTIDNKVKISTVLGTADGFNCYSRRANETELTFLGTSVNSVLIDSRPNLNGAPERREYVIRLVIGNVEVGTQSDIAVVIVG